MQASTVCMRANLARVLGRLSMGVLVRAESCAVVRARACIRTRERPARALPCAHASAPARCGSNQKRGVSALRLGS
eukprot:5821402-Pleurochrysis_carterae.AAC.1